MEICVQPRLKQRFPELRALICNVDGVLVEKEKDELQRFKEEICNDIKRTYALETLKDVPIFRAYRDFFWRVGIDPTKVRPAAEALIRRVLGGKPIPTTNTLTDAYNLASIRTCIAMGAFDAKTINGELLLRMAVEGERFLGIGMAEPMELSGKEIVVSDADKLIAIYPYRDADQTRVTSSTQDVILLICGAPGIDEDILRGAGSVAVDFITKFCGGRGWVEK